MKNALKFSFFILTLIFSFNEVQAQWAGSSSTLGNIFRTGNVCIGGTSPEQLLTLSAENEPVLRFERTGATKWDYEIYSTSGGQLRFRGGGDFTDSNLDDHMMIRGKGQVSIGTSQAPISIAGIDIEKFRLYVAGGILTEEVIVRTGWADYVFEDDYKLIPLAAVEDHINTNGYLHNTPSAKAIEEGGLQLGALTVNQQEKIEEIFLHMIANEKRVNELEQEILLLKSKLATSQK